MLGELSQWDDYRRVARDVHQLRRDQDDLAARTQELTLQTLGKPAADLTPQERAAVRRLAQQQGELAIRFEQTLGRVRDIAATLEATDPLAAETLQDATRRRLSPRTVGRHAREPRDLENNRLGQAAQQQKTTAAGLEELLDVLSNRREHELNRLVEKLHEATGELQAKQQQLKELRKNWSKRPAPRTRPSRSGNSNASRASNNGWPRKSSAVAGCSALQAERAGQSARGRGKAR